MRVFVPFFSCSIFILSNETVNIWSHLLGFLLFFSLAVNDLSSVLPASGANREDYVIYAIGLFCFQVKLIWLCALQSDKSCNFHLLVISEKVLYYHPHIVASK